MRFLVLAAVIFSVLVVSGCSEQTPFAIKESGGAPRPRVEMPPTKPAPAPPALPLPEVVKWVPRDSDIIGRWKKPCSSLPGPHAKSGREEINFVDNDSRIIHTVFTYSDELCSKDKQISAAPLELAFEDGWYAIGPQLKGVFVRGWRGVFRNEHTGADPEDYEAVVHLAQESGERVLYLAWSINKPVLLDAVKDRYVFVSRQ